MNKKFTKWILGITSALLLAVTLTACSVNPPKYNPNAKVGPQVNYTITGIDSGAGIMSSTTKAINTYGLKKEKWQLQASSTAAMLSSLDKALKYKQPIVITGWTPHWMFQKYPIKFLKDPKNAYGKGEHIQTIIHKGFEKKDPGATKLLKQFHWNDELMSEVMFKIDKGENAEKASKEFIAKHPELVKQWLNGVPEGHGQPVKLVLVSWDSELSSSNVVAQLLRMKGYKPTLSAMEAQPMWTSLSTGSADASTAGWLPTTMAPMYKKYKNNVEIIGTSIDKAKVGLAVPKYMKNVNSIEDLKNK